MTGLTHERVTDQAEQHIYQAQLLIPGTGATSLLALAANTAKVSAFHWKLSSQAQTGKGRALLLHFPPCFRKKLCRITKSSKAVGHLCQIMKAKQKSEDSVCVCSQACLRAGCGTQSKHPGETCHCTTKPKISAYSVIRLTIHFCLQLMKAKPKYITKS